MKVRNRRFRSRQSRPIWLNRRFEQIAETVRFEELNAVKLEETESFGEREVEDSGTEKD